MSYRVVWRERLLRSIHVFTFLRLHNTGEADELERAVVEIERRLSLDPATEGESRGGEERVLIVHPLSVTFEVFDLQRAVMIYDLVLSPACRGDTRTSDGSCIGPVEIACFRASAGR